MQIFVEFLISALIQTTQTSTLDFLKGNFVLRFRRRIFLIISEL